MSVQNIASNLLKSSFLLSNGPEKNSPLLTASENQKKITKKYEENLRTIFENETIPPEDFSSFFQKKTKQKNFSRILAFHEAAKTVAKDFFSYEDQIPPITQYKSRFLDEVKEKSLLTLFHQYDIYKLHSHQFVSDKVLDTYKKYVFNYNFKENEIEKIDKSFKEKYDVALKTFESGIKKMQNFDPNSQTGKKLNELFISFQTQHPTNWKNLSTSNPSIAKESEIATKFIEEISILNEERKVKINNLIIVFDEICNEMNKIFLNQENLKNIDFVISIKSI